MLNFSEPYFFICELQMISHGVNDGLTEIYSENITQSKPSINVSCTFIFVVQI